MVHRSLTTALVLALASTLLVVLPVAAPQVTGGGGLAPHAQAHHVDSGQPTPDIPLPDCPEGNEDRPFEVNCGHDRQYVGMSYSGGTLGTDQTVTVTFEPKVPACDASTMWNGSEWTTPCHRTVRWIDSVDTTCATVSLDGERAGRGRCYPNLEADGEPLEARNLLFDGGGAGIAGSNRCRGQLSCEITWTGPEPDLLSGPLYRGIHARATIEGLPDDTHHQVGFAQVWIPVDGTLAIPFPEVDFAHESQGGLTVAFTQQSSHALGLPLTHHWNFDDGTGWVEEANPVHTFPEPGTYWVKLSSQDGHHFPQETKQVVVEEVTDLEGEWFRPDGAGNHVLEEETVPVRLRVDNPTGVEITDLELVSRSVVGTGDEPGAAQLGAPSSDTEGREVLHGELPDSLDATGPGSVGFVDFDLTGDTKGAVRLVAEVQGKDPDGETVTGTIEADFTVRRTDLKVTIEFDPPEIDQKDRPDPEEPPVPEELTATVTVTNVTGGPVTGVRIEEFKVSRTFPDQQIFLEQTGGLPVTNGGILLEQEADPPPEPFDLADGESRVFTPTFTARDDGDLEFSVLALGADDRGRTVSGFAEEIWEVVPEKFLEVITRVVSPSGPRLLEAGDDIVIVGTVENLSQSADIEVGPLLPEPSGNTGLMSLHYGVGQAPDPELMLPLPTLELGPGDLEVFEVRIQTNQSDPRTQVTTGDPEVAPSGGTRAILEFDPWGIATERRTGTVRTVRTDPQGPDDRGVKLDEQHRELIVGIDDSIAIPETDPILLAGGIMEGTLIGVKNGTVALVYGLVDAVKLPYTVLRGTWEYQSQVWDSFTEQEKREFIAGTRSLALESARRTVELGLQDAGVLWEQINQHMYSELTKLQNEWEVGDYVSTARVYSAGASEAIGSAVMPIALAKLARTPRAAAAIERAQQAINARMGPVFAEARKLQYVEDALPLLRALENGTEISADVMWQLYGVTPDEVGELQRLAAKYDVLLTFRSRHPSSVAWIRKFGAMMKPEAIKIKSVSEMDVALGYRQGDLGSVVFRKPEVLRTAPGDGVAFPDHVREFVRSRGFTPGTKDFDSAVDRVKLRVKEWYKHEQAYKDYDRRKSIPTEFNYEGNAIRNAVPDTRSRQTGFRLEKVGDEEYVVKLLDPRDGKYKRVTGDIDPIAFTNLDGSPLTQSQHRDLMNEMRASAKLRAQHPESATFTGNVGGKQVVEPGLDFIEDQFKPLEAAAQIGPTGPARAVRLNKNKSRWENPRDYHLHWEGGYVHTGGRPKIVQRTEFDPDFGRDVDVEVPVDFDFKPVQLGELGEAGIGRATLQAVKTGAGTAVFVGEGGKLIEVNPDGTTQPWAGGAEILEEGEPITLEIAPAGQVESTVTEVQGAAMLGLFGGRQFLAAPRSPAADGVVLVDDGAPMLFEAGQVVAVGVQDGQGDLRTIAEVDGRTLLFTEPVAAAVDDVVVMIQPASDGAVDPGHDAADGASDESGNSGDDAATDAVAGDGDDAADPAPVARDDLPAAGADSGAALRMALGFLLLGAVLLQAGRRRRDGPMHGTLGRPEEGSPPR